MSELYKFPSDFVSDQFVKYIDREEIATITQTLAKMINERYQGEDLIIVSVLKGGMIFLADFVRHLKNINVYIDFVHLTSIGRDKESGGTILLKKDVKTNLQGKNVLILEEIIDTGRALHFLKERIKLGNPRSLEVLTLFDKPYQRVVPVKADYIGKQLEDQFVVGYGLDLDHFGRNISDLYYLKYPN